MLTLFSGGAASGKSEFAESVAADCIGRKIYIATMHISDEEGRKRVARHRAMRRQKGFETVECPGSLTIEAPEGSTVLLECLSNLTANECFGGMGFDGAEKRIFTGIELLRKSAACVIIVTNELFSDGIFYGAETMRYLDILASLNRSIAAEADQVIEVVCGIPVYWKGKAR